MKTLIALGANADECNGDKLTPLRLAKHVQKKNKDLLQLLKGVSKTDPMPVQETVGAPRPMDVGDEQTISKGNPSVPLHLIRRYVSPFFLFYLCLTFLL